MAISPKEAREVTDHLVPPKERSELAAFLARMEIRIDENVRQSRFTVGVQGHERSTVLVPLGLGPDQEQWLAALPEWAHSELTEALELRYVRAGWAIVDLNLQGGTIELGLEWAALKDGDGQPTPILD